ncbi:MAG: caspase family protein, partial [Humidesulfovibrio sp.]|nr:caspase family protein [Humidesulfovibrio sp.]
MIPLRQTLTLCVALFLPLLAMASAWAETPQHRLALVIGNSAYESSPLHNPVNDATDMGNMLKSMGFEVIRELNANQKQMENAIRTFQGRLGKDSVGLFFYAGHGMQVSGTNYLVPVGAKINQESEVKYDCVDAGRVLDAMHTAGNPLNIVILDACRDNPFARSYRSSAKGLARMDAPTGTFIAYATAPGDTAADGSGKNGVFTKYMLEYMPTPNLEVDKVLKKVRVSVMRETGKKQVPWQASSLTGDFFFRGGGEAEGPADKAVAEEWAKIERERKEIAELKSQIERSKGAQSAPAAAAKAPAPAALRPQAAARPPKLMFLLQEDCLDCAVKGVNMAENELIAKLTEKGYPLIDKSQLEAANQMGQARLALSGNVDAAKQLGAMFGAKYVLVGKAVIQDGGEIMPGAGLKSIQTNIQLKIISAQTGQIVGATVKSASAAHISALNGAQKALAQAARDTVDSFVEPTLTAAAAKAGSEGGAVRVFATGVRNMAVYGALVAALEKT